MLTTLPLKTLTILLKADIDYVRSEVIRVSAVTKRKRLFLNI